MRERFRTMLREVEDETDDEDEQELVADGGRDVPEDADGVLELADEGLEMPEFLRGYTGTFTVRTADVTGEMETTDSGLPDEEYNDGLLAVYPDDDGEYNGHLRAGLLSFETVGHRETVFKVVDVRSEANQNEASA